MKTLKTDCLRKPAEDGFRMPGEFEEQDGCLMIWPWRPGSWNYGAKEAGKAFAKIAGKIAEKENLYMFVRSQDRRTAEELLDAMHNERIHLIEAESDDAWARDTGATFVVNDNGERRGIDWEFNAWGGEIDGLYAHWEKDQKVAQKICEYLGDQLYDAHPFVLEGGSIHVDGEGTLITTKECLLSPGRNPKLSQAQIEQKLSEYLNVKKIIWLPLGIYNDETNGHVDNICCFVKPGEVVLAWTDKEEDPQYARSRAAYEVLNNTTDARGRKIKIHKLLIPDSPICITQEDLNGYEFEEGEDVREVGERLAASYVNFYIANHCVLVPQFGDINDENAVTVLKECFPDRQIVPVDARVILTGGGNIHCITQQIPQKTGGRKKTANETD